MHIVTKIVRGIIFDLDGVLVDSRNAVDAAWTTWAHQHGLPAEFVRTTIPGKRTEDAVALLAPGLDARSEAARIVATEQRLVHEVTAVPGARELVAQLPAERWGIATSGTDAVARGRLQQVGLPVPAVFITAEMVARGKPSPDVYLQAAAALDIDPTECIVFEDAPSGIAAASAAGCVVVGVLTWADRRLLETPFVVRDLRDVETVTTSESISLRFMSID